MGGLTTAALPVTTAPKVRWIYKNHHKFDNTLRTLTTRPHACLSVKRK